MIGRESLLVIIDCIVRDEYNSVIFNWLALCHDHLFSDKNIWWIFFSDPGDLYWP